MRSVIALTVLFGVLHVWALLQGVSNLVAAPAVFAFYGLSVPWVLIVLGLVIPIATFTLAILVGRRRVVSHRVALLVVSLATANAAVLSLGSLPVILVAFQAG